MPRIKSKQIIGETPTQLDHLTPKGYVDDLVSSTIVNQGINIADDGEEILQGVKSINFIGGGVYVYVDDLLNKKVNIYIPPVEYNSHFNTNDGLLNAEVVKPILTDRYISLPTIEGQPFNIGNWGNSTIAKTIKGDSMLIYTTQNQFSLIDINTTIKTIIYDADNITELASHELNLNSNDTFTNNNITYIVSNFVIDKNKYKANITIKINISNIISSGGRFSINITHNNGIDGVFTFTDNDLFYDTDSVSITSSNELSLTPESPFLLKYLSGVMFLTSNSTFKIELLNLNNLNTLTYPITKQIEIIGTNTFTDNIEINGEGGTFETFSGNSWNNFYNTSNVFYIKEGIIIKNVNTSTWNHITNSVDDVKLLGNIYDWGLLATIETPNYPYIIDTLVDDSTRNKECFITETYRLNSSLTTWDSTENINIYDGGNGLQVLSNRLVYPKTDFTQFNTFVTEPDYSISTGVRYYYRKFETDGRYVSNGIIEFSDYNITESDIIYNRIGFEISVDNGASWFTLNKSYEGNILQNNSGCRIDNTDYSIGSGLINNNALRFTLGYGGSSTNIHLKIKYTHASVNKYIGNIEIKSSYWL